MPKEAQPQIPSDRPPQAGQRLLRLLGVSGGSPLPGEVGQVRDWPPEALVCQCLKVRRDTLDAACAQGARTVEDLALRTGASTACGSCRPLLAQLVALPRAVAPGRAGRGLLLASGAAFFGILLVAVTRPVPAAESVQGGWAVGMLWHDAGWKQATGFTLLGVSLLGLALSFRRRIAHHAGFGALTLVALTAHTGFRFGQNLNALLMVSFLAMIAVGAVAGGIVALEHRLGRRIGQRLRRACAGTHLLLLGPLTGLLIFHVLRTYYF